MMIRPVKETIFKKKKGGGWYEYISHNWKKKDYSYKLEVANVLKFDLNTFHKMEKRDYL